MVPLPVFDSFDALNAYLEDCCRKRQEDILYGHRETIGQRLIRDEAAFLPLPAVPYEACHCQAARVSGESLVHYKGNAYSVPVRYGYRDVWVKGYVQKVVISCGADIIAVHERCYEKGKTFFCPLHYLPLLEQKTGAFDQAAPLAQWALPAIFEKLKTTLERRDGKQGKREYVRVLRLLETFPLNALEEAVEDALHLGVPHLEAIKHLLLCRLEQRPAHLDLLAYPHLPAVSVKQTRAHDYTQLLKER
jgi:hypothetical protein